MEEQNNEQDVEVLDTRIEEVQAGTEKFKAPVHRFKIDWQGKQEEVKVRRLSFGERADLNEKSNKVEYIGKRQKITFSYKEHLMQSMLMCLVKAPFPITHQYIYYEIDPDVGDDIFSRIKRLNKLSKELEKNSDGVQDTK